ncbi:hypothetical protein [uncultured Marivirga sp.]|uniref:hypothetical protein n=1 Tax=uncultured Marivirga sp. TaxID=1123707 RepID=UPI0030ED3F37|tara:strand:+ start:265284 stop:265868 length:585 start_codon:yes stop_codon:yes gene_type:complete
MKNIFLFILILLPLESLAQDIIVLKNDSKIKCNVTEVSQTAVNYTKIEEQRPTYTVLTSNVSYIQFNSGRIDSLNEYRMLNDEKLINLAESDSLDAYSMGLSDGFKSYDAGSLQGATAITTFLLPPVGLATTIVSSGIPPRVDHLMQKNYSNKYYKKGFQDGSMLKKRKKAWKGFGTGFGVLIGVAVILGLSAG